MNKSWWHLPKVFFIFTLLGVFWFGLFKIMWGVHIFFYPEHSNHLDLFWQEGLSFKSFISSFLLLIPLLLPAMGSAMIVTNGLLWLTPAARATFDREAKKLKKPSFLISTSDLLLLFVKYLLPIGIGLSLLGALTLINLK